MLNVLLANEATKSIQIREENRKKKHENPESESSETKVEDSDENKEDEVDELNVLVNEIMESLTRLQENEYSYFSNCFIHLANLSNFGLIPNSTVFALL